MQRAIKSKDETPMLDAIERQPESYVQAGWAHFRVEGRGALFAMEGPSRGIETVFLTEGDTRRYFCEEGKEWLRWYRREVRPKIREYDPKREVVVLTCLGEPRVRTVTASETSMSSLYTSR